MEAFFVGFSKYFMPFRIFSEEVYKEPMGRSHGKFDSYDTPFSFSDQFLFFGSLYMVSWAFQVAAAKSQRMEKRPPKNAYKLFFYTNKFHLGIYSIVAS